MIVLNVSRFLRSSFSSWFISKVKIGSFHNSCFCRFSALFWAHYSVVWSTLQSFWNLYFLKTLDQWWKKLLGPNEPYGTVFQERCEDLESARKIPTGSIFHSWWKYSFVWLLYILCLPYTFLYKLYNSLYLD